MNTQVRTASSAPLKSSVQTNGAGAAAILAAGIGSFLLAVFAIAGDKSAALRGFFAFSKSTGPLSGVTTSTMVVWLAVWIVLHVRWQKRAVNLGGVNLCAIGLLLLALLLTFPPVADLF